MPNYLSYIGPAQDMVPVTPNDGADLPNGVCDALLIGTAGALQVTMVNGQVRTLPSVPVGILPGRVRRVHAAGTAATNIVAMYQQH